MDASRKAAAALFRKSSQDAKKAAAGWESSKRAKRMCLILAPAWRINAREVHEIWDTCDNPEEVMCDSYLTQVRIYHGAPTRWRDLMYDSVLELPLWKYFLKMLASPDISSPVIPFRMKGQKEYWILTTRQTATGISFMPRVVIPVRGKSLDVLVMPIGTFIKEYS